MDIEVIKDCSRVDWHTVAAILERVGMAHHAPEIHARAFAASHTTIFLYRAGQLIGFGRALSDGVYQAALYDCAVLPELQGQGLGRLLLEHLLASLTHCNVILYATPGKEGFYQALGFRRMKTGMALFTKGRDMQQRGFTE